MHRRIILDVLRIGVEGRARFRVGQRVVSLVAEVHSGGILALSWAGNCRRGVLGARVVATHFGLERRAASDRERYRAQVGRRGRVRAEKSREKKGVREAGTRLEKGKGD